MMIHRFALLLIATFACMFVINDTSYAQDNRTNKINAPNGDRKYSDFNGGGVYRWSGVVRNVTFGNLNGNTTLDLSKLKAANITIGEIDGASAVLLNATQDVTITGKIDGRSWVAVQAGGKITIKGKIDGRSRVCLKAEGDITVEQKLDGGPCTLLVVGSKSNINLQDKVDGKAVFQEQDVDEMHPLDLNKFPYDKVCDSDAKDYPRPPKP